MRNILTISKRELTRLRSRLGGDARATILALALGALALTWFAQQQPLTVGAGLYRVGVTSNTPAIHDSKFNIVNVDSATGRTLLDQKAIDVFVDGASVLTRTDDKSRYAAGALKRYLEKRETARINAEYDIAQAFPLRVEINYFTASGESASPLPPELTNPTPATAPPSNEPQTAPAASDAAVREQIRAAESGVLPQIQSLTDKEIIVPSLTAPPNPFGQVILAFLYIMPVFLVSVFFTSGFMDEKTNRKLTMLLSAPITPFQIIIGKMLPYVTFSLCGVVAIALLTHGDPLLALLIFAPAVFFIFGIYLMVPMLYRTFKDTTFISMLATSLTTAYLITPAMFSGISDLAYMSPITLAVKMYRNETFGLPEYLFAATPLVLIFALALYISTRVLNEEFLMGFRPLHRKLADAIFLIINREHLSTSIFVLSLLLIPLVYLAQLIALAISLNLPMTLTLAGILFVAAILEELAKSAGIVVLREHGLIHSTRQVLTLTFLSALGFLVGEKGLLLVTLSAVAQSSIAGTLFNTGLLPVPLAAHFIFTSIVCLLTTRLHVRYPFALFTGALLHALYNFALIRGML
jgi:ABC-type Na+ efflux pump permease subunit